MPIECKDGESKRDCASRCISTEIKAGKPRDQASAICLNSDEQEIHMFNTATLGESYNLQEQDGVQYVVVPVTMIVEGVLNNAFYSKEELSRNVNQWNGKPLPLGHPTDEDGRFIMANTPEVVKKLSVGQVWNTKFLVDDGVGMLKGEAWINIDKATELAPELMKRIENSEKIEVSTGLFTDAVLNPGIFNGESYEWVVSNFRPDHLAILVDETGACSVKDGCGLNNSSSWKIQLSRAKKKIINTFSANKLSYREQRNSAESEIIQKVKPTNNMYVSVVEMYNDNFIYQIWRDHDEPELYRVNYTLEDDKVVLAEKEERVKMETNFVSVETDPNTIKINSDQNKNKTPNKGESQMDELVNELINNSATGFAESDRDYLMSLDENRLKAFTPQVTNNTSDGSDEECKDCGEESDVSTNKEAKDEAPTVNAEDVAKLVQSVNDLKKELPTMIANAVEAKHTQDSKAPIIEKLKANGCKLSDKALDAMSVEDLHELTANYAQAQNQYFGIAVPESPIGNVGADQTPKMPVLFEVNKDKQGEA
jgi:hypothetical protein